MKQTFEEMSKPERKHFLNMDLVERMIRVEQRVSASFRKYVSYQQTEYFQSLTPSERKEFEKYLKMKKLKKVGTLVVLSSILVVLVLGGLNMTGAVIGVNNYGTINLSLIVFCLALVALLLFILWGKGKRKRHRRLNSHTHILHRYLG